MKSFLKILVITISLIIVGCSSTADLIVQNENNEILRLQQQRALVAARPTSNAKEEAAKQAELTQITQQINASLNNAIKSQMVSSRQNEDRLGNAWGIGAGIIGGTLLIDSLTNGH